MIQTGMKQREKGRGNENADDKQGSCEDAEKIFIFYKLTNIICKRYCWTCSKGFQAISQQTQMVF